MKICVPIVSGNVKDCISDIKEANAKADLIELRLDFMERLSEADLKRLLKACKKPVIATNRKRAEGGKFEGDETKRVGVLENAARLGADFVDIEFHSEKKLLEKILKAKGKAKVILSYHSFSGTPALEELERLLDRMSALRPAVVKIVTAAKSEEDNKTILALVQAAKSKGVKIVAFCMGPLGTISRVSSPQLGAEFSFASLRTGKESAPGQLSVDEMRAFEDS
ncbi:MAG: type I 3-dehydroquinate dehydratase [Candidatus Diapherotrites archaeon]|nr:type I 3-dehydroquinate dehydratase [Candidatus Diapherotrites archaeon]